ncbi:14 kDa subunit of cytochrome bd ubiquinol oxidase [Neolentinus lepideus HHB14362 ss-1]|uniref:Cytochrome b-c1 complex subunit 7 n=1 Tax=Neolentinus lepideus HHB14362 ss-1 TaxID=1314782 RepID=A0A165URC0_9AGAM|nr:14 kDa subunit of cytochrome bd ubiquinol oxidase [Neolentinus lepideus HHB14362 ss-1]
MFGPLGFTLAPSVRRSRTLYKWVKPLADWYANLAGYRKMGLKYDDLLVEENPEVQKALTRLTPREAYDRAYRFKVASLLSVNHKPLPKDQWLPASEDSRYLKPYVEEVVKETEERRVWDTLEVRRK